MINKTYILKKTIKIATPFLIAAGIIFSCPNQSKAAVSGDFKYESTKGGLSITGYTGKSKVVKIPAKIGKKKVVKISRKAFNSNTKITSVTMPDSVTSVDSNSFENCKKLKKVKLSSNLSVIKNLTFKNCKSLSSINFDNVLEIGANAFENNESLTGEITFAKIRSIERNAFTNCRNIQVVNLPDTLDILGHEYPNYLDNSNYIYSCNPFVNCSSLTSINVSADNPNFTNYNGALCSKSMDTIIAFPCAISQLSYVLPETTKKISAYAFAYTNVEEVIFGNSITSIGEHAFDSSKIKRAKLPNFDGTASYGLSNTAFINCKDLVSFSYPENLTNYTVFQLEGCSSLKEVFLPPQLEIIDCYSFKNCTSLESITLPETVYCIDNNAFSGCTSLKDINLSKVKDIGNNAFKDCRSLSGSLTLNAESIGGSCFEGCTGITEFIFTNPDIGFCKYSGFIFSYNPFSKCTSLTNIKFENSNYYKVIDNALYTSDLSNLITVFPGKSGKFILPYGNVNIFANALTSSNITDLVTSSSTKYLFDNSLNCDTLKTVYLGDKITDIGTSFCPNLESYEVSKKNKKFFSKDGILYASKSGSKSLLLSYPANKKGSSFSLPAKCDISDCAFYNCKNLKKVTIPEGFTGFKSIPFKKCRNIKLYLPKSIKKMKIINICIDEEKQIFANTNIFYPDCKNCLVYIPAKSILLNGKNKATLLFKYKIKK